MKILITGSAGFIGGYLVKELLNHGHEVMGIDNFSKYGKTEISGYKFIEGDVKDTELLKSLAIDCDQIVANAAMIGGISYFHKFAYDLLAENERITASTFDAAIHAFKYGKLKKINVVSSSMVYENTVLFPTPEESRCFPPSSTYGFQKLATEYFAKGAYEQYGLPYTIIRPFNCVGIGEDKKMSHVVPDLVQKVLDGQDPLHILGLGNQIRHYTYGGDLAEGIRLCIERSGAVNQDFNLSTAESTDVLTLAQLIWKKINGDKPFHYVSDESFKYDVQKRVPDVSKAKEVLGFEAKTSLSDMLDIVISSCGKKEELKTSDFCESCKSE